MAAPLHPQPKGRDLYFCIVMVFQMGFPGGSDGKDCLQCRRPGFNPCPDCSVVKTMPANAEDAGSISGSRSSPGGGKWQPTPVFLPGESPWTQKPASYNPWGCKE